MSGVYNKFDTPTKVGIIFVLKIKKIMGYKNLHSGIYEILNIVTNKRYIGMSKCIQYRWDNHKQDLKNNRHSNPHLQESYNKYGKECFQFKILEHISKENTKEYFEQIELKWVNLFDTLNPKKGYNMTKPTDVYFYKKKKPIFKKSPVCLNTLKIYCITNSKTYNSVKECCLELGLKEKSVRSCYRYWNNPPKERRKSVKGYMFCKLDEYNPNFDYVNFIHERIYTKKEISSRYKLELTNIITNEVIIHNGVTSASKYFKMDKKKITQCINNEFKKFSCKGYYIRKI